MCSRFAEAIASDATRDGAWADSACAPSRFFAPEALFLFSPGKSSGGRGPEAPGPIWPRPEVKSERSGKNWWMQTYIRRQLFWQRPYGLSALLDLIAAAAFMAGGDRQVLQKQVQPFFRVFLSRHPNGKFILSKRVLLCLLSSLFYRNSSCPLPHSRQHFCIHSPCVAYSRRCVQFCLPRRHRLGSFLAFPQVVSANHCCLL